MSRPLRLEYPGALWHVTNRGIEQRWIYADDSERVHFLHLLEKVIDHYRWQLLAYVLMSNHYHLFFRTPETNLSRGMKDLDGDYASFFNVRHQRAGHLFQGRFKSHLVDGETHLLSLARYIVLNPVRARMVKTPGDWRWSSYRATAGLAPMPGWLDPAPILDVFNGDDWNVAMDGYRAFVAEAIGMDASPWESLVAGIFLGGTRFLRQVEARIRERKCSDEHPLDQREFRATTIESVIAVAESLGTFRCWPPPPGSDGRVLVALLAARHARASHTAIGRLLGVTGRGALHLIRLGEERVKRDSLFAALVLDAESRLA
jgi:REP element-mobilizing transposase RayT